MVIKIYWFEFLLFLKTQVVISWYRLEYPTSAKTSLRFRALHRDRKWKSKTERDLQRSPRATMLLVQRWPTDFKKLQAFHTTIQFSKFRRLYLQDFINMSKYVFKLSCKNCIKNLVLSSSAAYSTYTIHANMTRVCIVVSLYLRRVSRYRRQEFYSRKKKY